MYTTYYPNLQPYIVEQRTNGTRNGTVYIYNATGQLINKMDYSNIQAYYIEYWQNGIRHNEHGPSCMFWYGDGQIYYISYWQNDLRHNKHGPACMFWNNGQFYRIEYYHFGKLIQKYRF